MSTQTVEERLASIEATLPHLATKADIERLKANMELSKIGMIKWFVGIGLSAAAIAATIASIFVTWAMP